MSDFVKLAKQYCKAGYSVIPVGTNKIPTIRGWAEFQNRPMTEQECEKYFKGSYGMALICGGKHSLTTIDIDLKNDLSGDLYERIKRRLPKDILKKMYVQRTQSGGYHFVFSCPGMIEANQKLASRFTTVDEKHQVYMENFENPLLRDKALKIASQYNHLCTIETRGEKGYILISPTEGYTHIYGKIGVMTIDEYHIILETMREFNEVSKTVVKDSRMNINSNEWKLSPFEHYNRDGDVVHLLEMAGWTAVNNHGKNIRFKRPGKSSTSSALFDVNTRIFTCFSTSTTFDANKGYNCSMLLSHLEHNDDFGQTYKYLVDKGFGIKN